MQFPIRVFAAIFLAAMPAWAGPAPAVSKTPIPTVLTQAARRVELFDLLSYPARVEPKVNANVLAESDGVVVKLEAPLGAKVARRARLFTLKHTDPIYQYAPVAVTSPVAGVVSQVEVTEGSLVTKGQKLATVTDPARVRIVVEAAAADLGSLKTGLEGELKIFGRDPVKVKVRGVSPFVDPATGTATCELEAGGAQLPPGALGQVSFKVNARHGFSLPEHAVVYRGAETFLRIVEGGKARYLKISLGKRSRGSVEVVGGLNEGMQVIERASAYVADGDEVTAQGAEL